VIYIFFSGFLLSNEFYASINHNIGMTNMIFLLKKYLRKMHLVTLRKLRTLLILEP